MIRVLHEKDAMADTEYRVSGLGFIAVWKVELGVWSRGFFYSGEHPKQA